MRSNNSSESSARKKKSSNNLSTSSDRERGDGDRREFASNLNAWGQPEEEESEDSWAEADLDSVAEEEQAEYSGWVAWFVEFLRRF
jgi:hypothetical protein